VQLAVQVVAVRVVIPEAEPVVLEQQAKVTLVVTVLLMPVVHMVLEEEAVLAQ
jgi:hypothetical protein